MPFLPIPADPRLSPFLKISQDSITLLETITAAEKAQAVPYVKIWEIEPHTGQPIGGGQLGEPKSSISFDLVRTPLFGASVKDGAERFRERPPVSLSRVSIVSEAPIGLILYRNIKLSFVVHSPDTLFEESSDKQVWSSLIIPGRAFTLEYGWSASTGVKNGLINGFDHVDQASKVVVPSRMRLRFTVTNYSFQILPDNQIQVEVQAIEDGESTLQNSAYVVAEKSQEPIDPNSERGLAIVKKMHDQMRNKLTKKKGAKGVPPPVEFSKVLDDLFAPVIENAFRSLGYNVSLYVGNFNSRAGSTVKKYGNIKVAGQSIGKLPIPVNVITKYLGDMVKVGMQPTVYNFLSNFMRLLGNPEIYTGQEKLPDLRLKVVYANKARQANVYILDARETLTKFDPEDKKDVLTSQNKRDALKRKVAEKGVPYVSFLKGNSYIQDAQFQVQADDQIKSIFMYRHLSRKGTREEKVSQAEAINTRGIPTASRVMYSSAITGELKMIGNFAFDTFGMIWVDFGVPTWSGPFLIMGREDVLEKGSFVSSVRVQSAGDDPLGSQAANI